MNTNLEKWNYHLSIINDKSNEFISLQKEGKIIPNIYYVVHINGKISERTIIDVEYSHYKHGKTYFKGKNPTKKDINEIAEYSIKEIPFSIDNIHFKYSEIWDKENNKISISSVKFNDVVNKIGLFHSLSEAEIHSQKVLEEKKIEKEFKELHKKDSKYNYNNNGYKFLGWQNGWKHEYFDEDGNSCSESGKTRKSFGYSKENYPEYRNCIDLKHLQIEVSHNTRGSENTVSCPICKVYWKYDCSD